MDFMMPQRKPGTLAQRLDTPANPKGKIISGSELIFKELREQSQQNLR